MLWSRQSLRLSWPLHEAGLGDGIWRVVLCPNYIVPFTSSRPYWQDANEYMVFIFETCFAAGVAGRLSLLTVKCLLGSTPDLLPAFTSIALSLFVYELKAAEVKNQAFPSPRWTVLLVWRGSGFDLSWALHIFRVLEAHIKSNVILTKDTRNQDKLQNSRI